MLNSSSAAENVYAVVSQAPNETGRVRVAYEAPQTGVSKEMDIVLIPDTGKEPVTAAENGLHVGDRVMIGFKENQNTGMFETSLTKISAVSQPQKEQQ